MKTYCGFCGEDLGPARKEKGRWIPTLEQLDKIDSHVAKKKHPGPYLEVR